MPRASQTVPISLIMSQDIDEEEGGIAPFTVFRTMEGVVAKSYLPEKEFSEWTKPIYNALK